MNIPESIIVTIPAQEFDPEKYLGQRQRCYLEDALDKAGLVGAKVLGFGETKFENEDPSSRWMPAEPFNGIAVKEAFDAGQAITVKLVKIYVS